jgi:hypothetical protein
MPPRPSRATFALPQAEPPTDESRLPVLLEQLNCRRCLGLKGTGDPREGTWRVCPVCEGSGYKAGIAHLVHGANGAEWWEVDLTHLGLEEEA